MRGISQVHTTSQSSPMQAYNQSITDLDKELDHLKATFEVYILLLAVISIVKKVGLLYLHVK